MAKNNRHYERVRREVAEELGFNPDKLSALQAARVDVVFALKLDLDEMRAKLFAGEDVDRAAMRAIADTLEKYLPVQPKPAEPVDIHDDPHARLMAIVDAWIANHEAEKAERVAAGLPADAKDARIVELEAENARLRGESAPIDPPTSDIVPPSEQTGSRNLRVGKQVGPDDHKAMRRRPVIEAEPVTTVDGKPVPAGSKVPPGNWGTVSGDEAKRRMAAVNNARSIEHRIMTEPSRVAHEPVPSLNNEPWRFTRGQ